MTLSDPLWRVVHTNERAVVKNLTRTGSTPDGRYLKNACDLLCVAAA